MISAYFVAPLVFGIVLSYLWLIHHFWLRHVFNEDHRPAVHTRIVILGGGFGGLYSALHFDKTIAADPTVEVTLVSRENFLLFTPMLHEVAAGDLDLSDIVSPLRPMLKHVHFLEADVEGIDLEERNVAEVVERLIAALEPEEVVLGGGNVRKLKKLPPLCRAGDNINAFSGGFRLWENSTGTIKFHGQL